MSEIIVNAIEARAGMGVYRIASEGLMAARRIIIDKIADPKVRNWKALVEADRALMTIWDVHHNRQWG